LAEDEPKPPRPDHVSKYRPPRVDWCCTCDKQLGAAMDPPEGIGPYHHLSFYPEHYVISVNGELIVWRAPKEEDS
jgi:hypothetical protein